MDNNEFYLSDDSGSDGDYEKFRLKKREYDDFILQEIQKQQDASIANSHPSHKNQGRGQRISLALSKISYIILNLAISAVVKVRSCRSEAVVACLLLGCTLFQMMNTTVVTSRAANAFGRSFPQNQTLPLPMDTYQHFVDLYDLNMNKEEYIPYLWSIPYSFQPINDVFFKCMGATAVDKPEEGFSEISIPSTSGAGPFNIFTSMNVYKSNQIFASQEKKGRVFAMMKNPVHSTIDAYRAYSQTGIQMSIEEYIDSNNFVDNWMTRVLTGKSITFDSGIGHEVTQDDVDFAMEVLSQKILVGIYPKMAEFIKRLEGLLSIDMVNGVVLNCRQQIFADSINAFASSLYPPENTPLWNTIYAKNNFDMQVYKYAVELFDDQAALSLKFAIGA
jgi:hypothetical protein